MLGIDSTLHREERFRGGAPVRRTTQNDMPRTTPAVAVKEGIVPLSEHEQRLLDEIEQALYAEDPKFASSVRSARRRPRLRSSVLLGVLGVLAGLGLVLVGLLTTLVVLSVAGFVLLVAAFGYSISSLRHRTTAATESRPTPARAQRAGTLRSRMEDRMRRRFDET
jgi:DUF3040 family protein